MTSHTGPAALDAAWEALREELDRRGMDLSYPALARHRPLIEAALRAEWPEYEATLDAEERARAALRATAPPEGAGGLDEAIAVIDRAYENAAGNDVGAWYWKNVIRIRLASEPTP